MIDGQVQVFSPTLSENDKGQGAAPSRLVTTLSESMRWPNRLRWRAGEASEMLFVVTSRRVVQVNCGELCQDTNRDSIHHHEPEGKVMQTRESLLEADNRYQPRTMTRKFTYLGVCSPHAEGALDGF